MRMTHPCQRRLSLPASVSVSLSGVYMCDCCVDVGLVRAECWLLALNARILYPMCACAGICTGEAP